MEEYKLKAREIVIKMQFQKEPLIFEQAKQCALIAVDEIIKSKKLNYLFTQNQINSMESTSDDRWIHETFIEYWDKVKHELEKL